MSSNVAGFRPFMARPRLRIAAVHCRKAVEHVSSWEAKGCRVRAPPLESCLPVVCCNETSRQGKARQGGCSSHGLQRESRSSPVALMPSLQQSPRQNFVVYYILKKTPAILDAIHFRKKSKASSHRRSVGMPPGGEHQAQTSSR